MKYRIEFFVGLFFLISIACFLIIAIKITDVSFFYKNEKTYSINAVFKNVGNLKKKSRVTICGVKIGFVKSIELKKTSGNEYYSHVEMFINSKINEIPKDSSINILMSNLLGDSYIQIDLGNDDFYLKDGDVVNFTTQALIIEELIAKFAISK
ncbi:MAG TPA: outer membrane lipid asymmetry maintenance protein MlaD [Candidatus Azoamicus sp. MARI]